MGFLEFSELSALLLEAHSAISTYLLPAEEFGPVFKVDLLRSGYCMGYAC